MLKIFFLLVVLSFPSVSHGLNNDGRNPSGPQASGISAPVTPDYYEKLFYTCKVWGFVKYFHSETADCTINLDSILLQKLPAIFAASDETAFNQVLLDLINSPGSPAPPTVPLPEVPDSLRYNLNLDWIQSTIFTQQVKDALDTIRVRFRPRSHCLVGEAFYNGNPTFKNDTLYNLNSGVYPSEPLRTLSLFRYWNILNYFFPYKNIMDQDWDTTLTEVIPLFIEAHTAREFDKAVMVMAKRINDSHAFVSGGVVYIIFGSYLPRFSISLIENETVITKVASSVSGIKAGDIVRAIDGVEIGLLRDSIGGYTHGSNDLAVSSFVHDDILMGSYGNFSITVENETGTNTLSPQRTWSSFEYNNFMQNTGPVWFDTVVNKGCTFGYVDMGRLTINEVGTMMDDLWNTDAIIFDIRNYPLSTLWTLANYLFTEPIPIANFTVPDNQYPGVLFWQNVSIGGYNTDVYQGKVIILFDIRTLSQAEYTCMGLEQHPGSIKIGNQTKAADGNVSEIYLQGNLTTYFTGLGTFYPDYEPTQRIGIIPDFEVWPTIEGIRQGKDEVLAYALDCSLVGLESRKNSEETLNICPNPFTSSTRLDYSLSCRAPVRTEILDLNGKVIFLIPDRVHPAGDFSVEIDGSKWPAGVYLCRLVSGDHVTVSKMIKVL
ncbi:MAG: T9SS type A sorting domain-containing protein [bacterium]